MCPFCLATAAVIAISAAGSGGLGALVAGVVLKKKPMESINKQVAQDNRNQYTLG